MKKRILFLLVAVIALIVTLTSCENWLEAAWPSFDPPGFNEEKEETVFPSVGLSYEFVTDEVTGEQYYMVVGRGSCTDEHIILPERYKTFPITHIADGAFMNDTALTGITLTNNIKWISSLAFAGTSITSFYVPSSVSTLGQGVFLNCKKLKTVTFRANSLVEALPALAFDGAENLTTVRFENGSSLKSVQAKAFYGLSSLQTVDFGDAEIENIDNYAFMFCEKLRSIKIPENTTNIGRFAFFGCKSLTEITLPASIDHIGENAFSTTAS